MKRLHVIILSAIVIVAGTVWWFSPTQVLKRSATGLLRTISIEEGSGQPEQHLKTFSLNRRLAADVELDTPTIPQANGVFEKSEIESGFSWLCSNAKSSSFKIDRIHSVEVHGDSGRVELTLEGLVDLKSYRPVEGKYEVELEWKRGEDGWRLTRASWREAGR